MNNDELALALAAAWDSGRTHGEFYGLGGARFDVSNPPETRDQAVRRILELVSA